MKSRIPKTCVRVLQWVGPLMLAGLLLAAFGFVLEIEWAYKAGFIAFLSGLPICGVGNVVPLVWALAETIREAGLHAFIRNLREEPRGWILVASIFLLYFSLAIGGIYLILGTLGACQ